LLDKLGLKFEKATKNLIKLEGRHFFWGFRMIAVERKGVNKAKYGLGLTVVLVVILAVSNAWTYTELQNQITSLNDVKNNLQTQVDKIQSQLDSLNRTHQAYVAAYPYSDSEYNALKNERDALKAPRLSTLSVSAIDERPIGGTPRLHIVGEVWNLGNDTAHNCRLKVVAYQDSVVAIDTYVSLGTITGYNKFPVDSTISYSGSALTSVDISPEWTT